MKVALAGLLACLTMAACGEAVAPTATAPAASVAPAPTATATPAPDPAASVAPAPASTATATPAPEEPDDFLEAALERMAEAGSVAFVMRMEMQAETEEGLRSASAVYTGDSRGFAYTTGTLAVNGLADTTEARFVALDSGLYEARYALDNDTQTWRFAEPLPEFMQLSHFLAPGNLVQEGFLPPQTLNGVEMRGVAGRYRSGSPGIEEDFDVTYWVGTQDGLLHSLTATAPRAGARDWVKLGGLGGLSGAVKLTIELSDYGKPVVVALPGLAFPIHLHNAIPLNDGRVLVTGGFTGVANNNVIVPFPLGFTQIYDPETETWTFLEPLQGRSVLNSAASLGDGGVLIVGLGFDEESVASIFDPADDSWEPLPDPPARRGAPNIVLLDDGRALAVGGIDAGSSGYSPDPAEFAEIFDPRTGEWRVVASMPRPALKQALVALPGGLALAVQTEDSGGWPSAAVYDSSSDVWRPTSPRQIPDYPDRVPEAIALPDGRALVTGWRNAASGDDRCGEAPGDGPCSLTGSAIYDPETDEWTPTSPMAEPRVDHTLTLLPDGRVLAAGGELLLADPQAQASETVVLATTEIFDPSSNSWSPGPDLEEARMHHAAALLRDGRVLFIGGVSIEDEPNPPGSELEIYPTNSVETLDLSG